MSRETCKYWDDRLKTCFALVSAIYGIEGCGTGGLAHVAIDDGNIDKKTLQWTIGECIKQSGRPEAPIVRLLCEKLLELPLETRLFFLHRLSFGVEQAPACWKNKNAEECDCETCITEIKIDEGRAESPEPGEEEARKRRCVWRDFTMLTPCVVNKDRTKAWFRPTPVVEFDKDEFIKNPEKYTMEQMEFLSKWCECARENMLKFIRDTMRSYGAEAKEV